MRAVSVGAHGGHSSIAPEVKTEAAERQFAAFGERGQDEAASQALKELRVRLLPWSCSRDTTPINGQTARRSPRSTNLVPPFNERTTTISLRLGLVWFWLWDRSRRISFAQGPCCGYPRSCSPFLWRLLTWRIPSCGINESACTCTPETELKGSVSCTLQRLAG